MKCIQCHTDNKDSLRECEKCGAPLPVITWSSRFWNRSVPLVIAIFLFIGGGFAYIYRDSMFPPIQLMESISVADKESAEKDKQDKQEGLVVQEDGVKPAIGSAQTSSKDPNSEKEIVAGWVIITDPWGRQVRKFRAGLAGDGWMALPTRACLAGNRWHFYPDSGRMGEISGGLWILGDKVGLWHLKNSGNLDGPELTAWNKNEPVSWVSLESDNEYDGIKLSDRRAEGFFFSTPLPDYINEIGVFRQGDKIVGWSFGQWLAKGYMWPDRNVTDLEYKTWVRYFYNITFANGREEKFAKALAMQKGYSSLDQLATFIEGFRLQPKLAAEDMPQYLLPEEIIKQMRVIVNSAIHSGKGRRVADMLSSRVLKTIGDINLLMDIVPVIAADRDFEAATRLIEDSGRYIVRQRGRDVPALDKQHVQLYKDWLQSLVSEGDVNEGMRTYNSAKAYYPDDPHIHLFGVELALLSGDWEEAERLLYMRNYPADLQDRYQLLALRISDMKGEEEKIVISFLPRSNRITVTAAINETIYQNFLVDTGATTVTIPSSTAEALGLEIIHGQRNLWTASGSVKVNEVIIDAMEIDGWVEYNVRAVVLDIPDRPGLGLLGLNYLGRFRMDLKTDEGTLLLNPR